MLVFKPANLFFVYNISLTFKCHTTLMKFSTQTNTWTITTNTDMLFFLNKSIRNFLEGSFSVNLYTYNLCRNGDRLEFNNQEDGFIMNYIDLNLTFFSSEGPKDQTLKPDFHLLVLLHLLILTAIEMII